MGAREQGRELRLQRIVDAARACFAEHGFAGTTVEAIAVRAEVSNGLLYKHFQGKEHLFQAVVGDIVRDWVRALVPAEAEALSPTQKLEAMLRRSVAFCRTNPLLPAVLSGDKRFELARIGNPERGRVHAHRQLIASVLADGIAKGEFRSDLEVDAMADVIQLIHAEYASRAYRNDPEFPYDDALVDAAVRFIRDAVVAERGGELG
ncbi:MAG: TetR/AcrR family transcriptional regulator [Myxococcota bacterium]